MSQSWLNEISKTVKKIHLKKKKKTNEFSNLLCVDVCSRINKKIPRGPPSPPAPVMHSPSKKVRAGPWSTTQAKPQRASQMDTEWHAQRFWVWVGPGGGGDRCGERGVGLGGGCGVGGVGKRSLEGKAWIEEHPKCVPLHVGGWQGAP